MKILNLILYNKDKFYDEMLDIQRKHLTRYDNITYFFYCYSNNMDEDYKIMEDMIHINGHEIYLPGILKKTIMSFKITFNYDYDYIIRSNISTIIDFNLLENLLIDKKPIYAGGHRENLQWLDLRGGIIDHRYRGTLYAQGTAIILSNDAIKLLLENEDKINYSVIDDVSLGLFYKNFDILPYNFDEYYAINLNKSLPNKIFYRNRNNDRKIDIINMYTISKCILINKEIKSLCGITKILYGTKNNYIDITDDFIYLFVTLDKMIKIKKNIVFNDFFGDPSFGNIKEILVYVADRVIQIDENVKNDINIVIVT